MLPVLLSVATRAGTHRDKDSVHVIIKQTSQVGLACLISALISLGLEMSMKPGITSWSGSP